MTIANLKILFTLAYLFNPNPSYDMRYFVSLITFFVILIILGALLFVSARRNKKKKHLVDLLSVIYNWLFWIGLGGLVLLFFRYEGISLVSMRFILVLWLIIFAFWGIYILVYYKRGYKKMLAEYKEQLEKEKYLGKRKK